MAASKVKAMQPGRTCPLHYRYSPEAIGESPVLPCETLYVVGGLYGNLPALDAILRMAAEEGRPVTLAFNGDFNWFDVDAPTFRRINEIVLRHVALRGNVETELAQNDVNAGCGCGYPDWVSDAEVERSNAIMARLKKTGEAFPELVDSIASLPMYCVAGIGGMRIGIVHGDAESLAGWRYAQERVRDDAQLTAIAGHFERGRVRVIACSHTCLPVMAAVHAAAGAAVLINNGTAGMPNFRGTHHGVITRIATTPAREPLYGTRLGALHIDALAVRYDHDAWLAAFLRNWPPGSPAHDSYHGRITAGPRYERAEAVRSRFAAAT